MAKFVSDDDYAACIFKDTLELVHSFKIVNFSKNSDLVSSFRKSILDLLYILDRSDIRY